MKAQDDLNDLHTPRSAWNPFKQQRHMRRRFPGNEVKTRDGEFTSHGWHSLPFDRREARRRTGDVAPGRLSRRRRLAPASRCGNDGRPGERTLPTFRFAGCRACRGRSNKYCEELLRILSSRWQLQPTRQSAIRQAGSLRYGVGSIFVRARTFLSVTAPPHPVRSSLLSSEPLPKRPDVRNVFRHVQ